MPDTTQDFRRELIKLGIISYSEKDTLYSIARKCAVTTGLPMGAAAGLASMKVGTVIVPGVGTMSGAVAGFLAGLFAGTLTCTAVNLAHRKELRELLD